MAWFRFPSSYLIEPPIRVGGLSSLCVIKFLSTFPTRILLATDGSPHAELAAIKAVELAKSTGARLHVVAVGRTFPAAVYDVYTEAWREDLRREAQEVLDAQVKKIEEAGGTVAIAHLKMNEHRDEAIVHLAEEIDADLIVIGSRGGWPRASAALRSFSVRGGGLLFENASRPRQPRLQ